MSLITHFSLFVWVFFSHSSEISNQIIFSVQFDAEFRRFSLDPQKASGFEDFEKLIGTVHRIQSIPFVLTYTDLHGDLLPINNDDNFQRAVITAKPILRVFVQRKGTWTMLVPRPPGSLIPGLLYVPSNRVFYLSLARELREQEGKTKGVSGQ